MSEQLHEALLSALAKADNNQSRFAADITRFAPDNPLSQQLVSYWVKNARPLPGEYAIPAEKAGFGHRSETRPDLYPPEEYRTHGADSAIDDEILEPAGLCSVCDLRLDHPAIGRCGEGECPHAARTAPQQDQQEAA